jgi:hypothetical protein
MRGEEGGRGEEGEVRRERWGGRGEEGEEEVSLLGLLVCTCFYFMA